MPWSRWGDAPWGDALLARLKGHSMTEQQAAVCIRAYWLRYIALSHYQEMRGATITLQVRARVRTGSVWPLFLLDASNCGRAPSASPHSLVCACAQAANRGMVQRIENREAAYAAARLQARLRGNFTRDVTDVEMVDFRCATAIQTMW